MNADTGCLVSVRSLEEARDAVECGVDIVDVKEPLAGPLGAAGPDVWRAVQQLIRETVAATTRPKFSIAMGELHEWSGAPLPADVCPDFAKVGLAGAGQQANGQEANGGGQLWNRWRRWQEALPDRTVPVAVAYADHVAANAPHPELVATRTAELGCRILLIDTYNKSHGSLWAHHSLDTIQGWCDLARGLQMDVAIAGSLSIDDVPTVSPFVNWVAVRGAVCSGERHGRVSRELVSELVATLADPAESQVP